MLKQALPNPAVASTANRVCVEAPAQWEALPPEETAKPLLIRLPWATRLPWKVASLRAFGRFHGYTEKMLDFLLGISIYFLKGIANIFSGRERDLMALPVSYTMGGMKVKLHRNCPKGNPHGIQRVVYIRDTDNLCTFRRIGLLCVNCGRLKLDKPKPGTAHSWRSEPPSPRKNIGRENIF